MIEVLDENLKKVDILRKYTFAQYEDMFRDVGTFKINARIVQDNLFLLDKTKEFYVLFDGTVFGKVENVKRESDSEYEQTIVLSGRLGLLLFTKRVIAGTIKFKGNTAQFVKEVIHNEVVKEATSKRYVNIDIQYDNEEHLNSFCSVVDKQVTGGYVWDSVQPALEQDKLGLYFVPIVETEHIPEGGTEPTNISKWKLTIGAGKDRTKGNTQGNVPVVFSQSLSNIARTNYELETKQYCNVAYVAGEGEEEQRKWYEVYAKEEVTQGEEDKSGWQRNELWIDARDVQSTDEEGNKLTDEEYEQLIKQRANEKFAENEKGESYTATITEANKQYTYGTDYKLGDWVTVIDDELGITVDAQVTAVTKSIEGVREIVDIDFTYGKVNRDPVDQIGNIGGITDKNSNDIKYLENKFVELNRKMLPVPITLIPESVNVPSGVSCRCWYYPVLGLAFLRVYLPPRSSRIYRQGEEYTLYTIPDGPGYPVFSYSALYVHGGVNNRVDARTNDGKITITPRLQDVAADNLLTIGGFWFTD